MLHLRLTAAAGACILLAAPAAAQGRSALSLPRLEKTAQSFVLGQGAANLEGLNALGGNPAALHTGEGEVLAQYQRLPLETDVTFLAASYPIGWTGGTAALSFLRFRSEGFDKRDAAGARQGSFAEEDSIAALHFSRPLGEDGPFSESGTRVGLSAKVLRMAIDAYSGTGFAFDAGIHRRAGSWPVWFGLSAANVGRGPVLHREASPLPTAIVASVAARAAGTLDIVARVSRGLAGSAPEYTLGLEYGLGGVLAFRAGFQQSGAAHSGGVPALAAGVGFNFLGRHSLDYSFQPYDASLRAAGAEGTHRATLTVRFTPRDPGRARRVIRTSTERNYESPREWEIPARSKKVQIGNTRIDW